VRPICPTVCCCSNWHRRFLPRNTNGVKCVKEFIGKVSQRYLVFIRIILESRADRYRVMRRAGLSTHLCLKWASITLQG
jgi:hypothetical protein